MILLEEYSEAYLAKSWEWLNDTQIKSLTNTTDFTKAEQQKWFLNLAKKVDYKIWGVSFDGVPIGVFGIKNIDLLCKEGEYWGYIGEKEYWGKGLGEIIINEVLHIATFTLGLDCVYLKVLESNKVARNLYKKCHFKEIRQDNGIITMVKGLQ
ncbi:GNAT family N-acetyltransferase [Flavobacterium degerlachei]|jgi:RimJ/RimL family protein N-acetyltransferase|uniref:Acetyltransferase (GNAT) domain-containing protein n=1 Tax=Flavobacterium degerlachei TaxID=229203 RepID=A0A1H2VPW2_9FLAO|nr:GNAT family N-acetyltransferase [Flavobacterium degerlachei]SDW70320.1 Acetyltransferase (GNAT) domain-containing protein [Flavobacterium degerlachei]